MKSFLAGCVHVCDPSTREAEAGRSQLQGQPGLHSKTLSQNNKNTPKPEKQQQNIF
jgi:hypothetical protein